MARVFLQRALNLSPEFDPYQARRARNALVSLGARGRGTNIAPIALILIRMDV